MEPALAPQCSFTASQLIAALQAGAPHSDSLWTLLASLAPSISALTAVIAIFIGAKAQREALAAGRDTAMASQRSVSRQDWVNNLRDNLAEFITLCYDIEQGYLHAMKKGTAWPGERMELVSKTDMVYNRIRLYLNPNKPEHQELFTAVCTLKEISNIPWDERREALTVIAQKVIKTAWDKAKNGE